MKPSDPVALLACAIATQEGFFVTGTTPAVRHNPGDLRYASQLNATTPGWDGTGTPPIATFPNDAMGITALCRQLYLQVAQGQTVRQLISQWAPPNENDTSAYLQNILTWTQLPADTPVLDLLPPLVKLA
jgi:hypothetical protein